MQLTKNYLLQEFVPKEIFEKFGANSIWFLDYRLPSYAQFLKEYLISHYQKKDSNIVNVLVIVNNWHTGGPHQYRGFRPRNCTEGADNSQHRFGRAMDCDIILVYADGKHVEADYKEIHSIIMADQKIFLDHGLGAIEDVAIASTWLHSDLRCTNTPTEILIVKP